MFTSLKKSRYKALCIYDSDIIQVSNHLSLSLTPQHLFQSVISVLKEKLQTYIYRYENSIDHFLHSSLHFVVLF